MDDPTLAPSHVQTQFSLHYRTFTARFTSGSPSSSSVT